MKAITRMATTHDASLLIKDRAGTLDSEADVSCLFIAFCLLRLSLGNTNAAVEYCTLRLSWGLGSF